MKQLLIIITALLLAVNANAQDYIRLWGNHPDDFRKKAVRLYHYQAGNGFANKAIIICPGGSYCYLAKENEGFSPARLFNSFGYDCFAKRAIPPSTASIR